MPKLSIIIPAYNAGKYITSTFDSLEKQTFEDFEIIVIDDSSTDDTRRKCDEYSLRTHRSFSVYSNFGGGVFRQLGIMA